MMLALVVLLAGCATSLQPSAAPARSISTTVIQLPTLTTVNGSVTQVFTTVSQPFHLTSVLMSYGAYTAATTRVQVDLHRGNDVYALLDVTPTNAVNSISWNVERMHGKITIRRLDELVYSLSDTNIVRISPTGGLD
jgi:hypothetical protein